MKSKSISYRTPSGYYVEKTILAQQALLMNQSESMKCNPMAK